MSLTSMPVCPKCGGEIAETFCPKCNKPAHTIWSNRGRVMDLVSGGVTSWVGLEVLRLGSPAIGALLASAGIYTFVRGVRRGKKRDKAAQ